MYCSQCATELGRDDVYCPVCSKPVASFAFDDRQARQVEPIEEQTIVRPPTRAAGPSPLRSPAFLIAAAVAVLATIGFGTVLGILLFQNRHGSQQQPPSSSDQAQNRAANATPSVTPTETPTPPPTPKPKIHIVDQSIHVAAGEEEQIAFNLTADSRVTGGYVTYGGSGEIDAELLSSDGRVMYSRADTPKDKIDLRLPAGSYRLVFSNKRAWFSEKTVAAELFYQEQ